jgi:hypothetical protein
MGHGFHGYVSHKKDSSQWIMDHRLDHGSWYAAICLSFCANLNCGGLIDHDFD